MKIAFIDTSKIAVIAHKLLMSVMRFFPSSHYALLSILFIVGLELIFALQRWLMAISITVVLVVAIGVILVKFEEKGTFRLLHAILPILATTGLSGFTFFLPTSAILHLYILAAGLVLFFLLKHGARQAFPIWNWTLSLVVYFLNLAFILGLRFHLYTPILLILGLVFILTALMGVQALRRVASSTADAILPVLGMSFALTEVVWLLQFLPSHYLVQAGVVTTLYYVIFSLISLSYSRKPHRRDVLEYLGVGTLALMIILLSAQW